MCLGEVFQCADSDFIASHKSCCFVKSACLCPLIYSYFVSFSGLCDDGEVGALNGCRQEEQLCVRMHAWESVVILGEDRYAAN